MIRETKDTKLQMVILVGSTQNIPLISESYTLTNSYDYKIYNEWLDENVLSYWLFW